jgi:hypothetical protein
MVRPVVENRLEEIEICTRGPRVEEALSDDPDPFTHASRLQEVLCAGHRPGEIDQRTVNFGSGVP